MAISKTVIEDIRARCDIVDVIGAFVQLKRSGASSYKGLCPFHNEKTPSFHVDVARQSYHCFGCGKGGDVFRFLMEKEGVTFYDAIHMLASREGVIIPDDDGGGDPAEARQRAGAKERLYRLNEAASEFFCRFLREHPDSEAAQYLRRRGIPDDVARKFRIGAAPDSWDALRNFCRTQGFTDEEGVTAGVLHRSENGRVFDQFRNRLVFSIFNEVNRGVGFSARSLEPKPQDGRKYVNTPETPVFRKGALLYALPLAREAINKRDMAILCEGQLDAIAFHRAGFECAVAPLGTAFTTDQARVLKRYTSHILLAFDADGAGQKAILRAAEILLPLSMELKVIRIPGGKDPDELFAAGGAEAVAAAVQGAVPWLEIVTQGLAERFDLGSPVGKGEAAAFVGGFLKLVENRVELESYVREAAARLQVSEEAIFAELAALRRQDRRRDEFRSAAVLPEKSAPQPQYPPAVLTLLDLAINSADAARLIGDLLAPDELPADDPVAKAINLAAAGALNDEHAAAVRELSALLDEQPSPALSKALVSHIDYPDVERAVEDSVRELRAGKTRKLRGELMERLRLSGDPEERSRLLAEIQKLR
ncbi:MAG: DNA primase [Lentisphaeria bacterium]|nr:DNA primase [Lentisphaeria bacterium]